MEAELKQNLLALSAAYAASLDIGVTTVWRQAINDPAFFDRLKSDKTITMRTYDRAAQWFSDNWPEGLAWPDAVQRPAPLAVEGL